MTPITPENISTLRPIFEFFDTDLDGNLTTVQVGQAMVQLGFADSMAVSLTDFPQFCRLVGLAKKKMFEKDALEGKLRLTFTLMDKEEKHHLGADVLMRHFKGVGLSLTKDQADRIAELIYPEDEVTFNEDAFVAFMKRQIALS